MNFSQQWSMMQEHCFTQQCTSQPAHQVCIQWRIERRQPSFQNLNFDLNVCKAAYLDLIRTKQPLNVIHCDLMRVVSLEGKVR
jgi:hypothetical protein